MVRKWEAHWIVSPSKSNETRHMVDINISKWVLFMSFQSLSINLYLSQINHQKLDYWLDQDSLSLPLFFHHIAQFTTSIYIYFANFFTANNVFDTCIVYCSWLVCVCLNCWLAFSTRWKEKYHFYWETATVRLADFKNPNPTWESFPHQHSTL